MADLNLGYVARKQFVELHGRISKKHKRELRWACVVSHRRGGKTVASVHDLQDWLGHSSLETTLLYLGLSDKKSLRVRNLVNNSRVATFA